MLMVPGRRTIAYRTATLSPVGAALFDLGEWPTRAQALVISTLVLMVVRAPLVVDR